MTTLKSRWDLSEVEVSASSKEAALHVVGRLTEQRDDVTRQWETAIRLARSNGASLRDIARVTGTSPQTVAKICDS
ncbi:MAG: hypothetical protein AAFZ07_14530 [Actinomycetota bacterium]